MNPWWVEEPAILDEELQALDRAGIRYKRDPDVEEEGILRIRAWPEVEGREIEVVATYPDLYPYFRFEVQAENESLPRHQNPFDKNLCLIGRNTSNWRQDDTLAAFLVNRLPGVIETATSEDPDDVADLEEHQGEPLSSYYPSQIDTNIVIDGTWEIDGHGDLLIGLDATPAPEILRGAVLEVRSETDRLLAEADRALRQRLELPTIRGRFVRVEAPPATDDAEHFRAELEAIHPHLSTPLWQKVGKDVHLDVVAVVFPEEVRWRERGDGWLVSVKMRRKRKPPSPKKGPKPPTTSTTETTCYFAAARRAGRADLASRIPELYPLRSKKILVVGTGGLGAPSALEFARAGVGELRLLDHDVIDPTTVVRWPAGLPMGGHPKVEGLRALIENNYPYTEVRPFLHRVGAVRLRPDIPSDLVVLEEALDGLDLVYDATAERGVSYALADLVRARGIPIIIASTTPGAWGGMIARLRAEDSAGCYLCFAHALDDGTITTPPFDPSGRVQPAGCADPTFTGAGFDIASIALAGVRLAVSTLCDGAPGAYPAVDWDVLSFSLRDPEEGGPGPGTLGRWRVDPHPSCPRCST